MSVFAQIPRHGGRGEPPNSKHVGPRTYVGGTPEEALQRAMDRPDPVFAGISEYVLFELVGLGRDPRVLALELLKLGKYHSSTIKVNLDKRGFKENLDKIRSRIEMEKEAFLEQNNDCQPEAEGEQSIDTIQLSQAHRIGRVLDLERT